MIVSAFSLFFYRPDTGVETFERSAKKEKWVNYDDCTVSGFFLTVGCLASRRVALPRNCDWFSNNALILASRRSSFSHALTTCIYAIHFSPKDRKLEPPLIFDRPLEERSECNKSHRERARPNANRSVNANDSKQARLEQFRLRFIRTKFEVIFTDTVSLRSSVNR